MIDNNKLLSRDRMATGRNVVTIKRNLIKIDNLLKERLVLVKVRQGILRQQEQNRIRRQREDNLESLQSTSVQGDSPDKQGSNLSGLIKSILGLSGIFLPQLLRLLNFLKGIVDPIKNMATATFKALSSFLKVGTMAVDKITDAFNFKGSTLKGLDETTITTKFNKFEFALNTFVNSLIFAGAMQTLSNLPDIKLVQNFLQKFKKIPVTTGNQIPIDDRFLLKPTKATANVIEQIFDLRNIQKPVETFSIPIKDRRFRVNPKGRRINPEDGGFFAKRRKTPIESFEKTLQSIEIKIPEFELFEFLSSNGLASPSLLSIDLNKQYATELRTLQDLNTDGKLVGNAYTQALGLLNDKYDNTVKSIDEYSKKILKYFKKGDLDAPLTDIFDSLIKIGQGGEEIKGIVGSTMYNINYEDFVPPKVPTGGGPGGNNFLNSFKESQFFDPMNPKASVIGGGFSDSFFNKSVTKPSAFKQSMNFLKGVDQTMVDFATKQTDKIASVITSGPLKGFTQGAKGMFRKAVGESIGLVPFLGDLIGLLLDIYLFGEIPERAGYKAIGGILGGFVGALIGSIPVLVPFGGPFIGSIIGGIGGDILGGIVYDMVKGKDTEVKTSDVGESTAKSTIKNVGSNTFLKGGYTGKGDPRKIAGLVHNREFVIDPDSTLAVRQNAPGFFEDLNRAKGFESLEVLRNFASYEGTQTAMAHFIPIPIPMPRKEVPPVIDMATGEVREDLVSSYHYARG